MLRIRSRSRDFNFQRAQGRLLIVANDVYCTGTDLAGTNVDLANADVGLGKVERAGPADNAVYINCLIRNVDGPVVEAHDPTCSDLDPIGSKRAGVEVDGSVATHAKEEYVFDSSVRYYHSAQTWAVADVECERIEKASDCTQGIRRNK
ncbi:MAG: hypothetical protein O3C43_22205 [Verrucomicrobia bacterium]|nr:hypothetical protein [Verrucomicrobiota bacterium]